MQNMDSEDTNKTRFGVHQHIYWSRNRMRYFAEQIFVVEEWLALALRLAREQKQSEEGRRRRTAQLCVHCSTAISQLYNVQDSPMFSAPVELQTYLISCPTPLQSQTQTHNPRNETNQSHQIKLQHFLLQRDLGAGLLRNMKQEKNKDHHQTSNGHYLTRSSTKISHTSFYQQQGNLQLI
jgi:hypothetical protein